MGIPKNIWIFWLQGFEVAPPFVKVCVSTWEQKNSGWTVYRLSEGSIRNYLDDSFVDRVLNLGLPPKKTANIFRLKLIACHGGVWADADCYCTRPLDSWIHEAAGNGFFAFRFDSDGWLGSKTLTAVHRIIDKTNDRVMANWFLAGQAGNVICESFAEKQIGLFEKIMPLETKWWRSPLRKILFKVFRRNAYLSSKLSTPKLLKYLGRYPYFIFHYQFANAALTDAEFRSKWKQVPVYSASEPLKFSKHLGAPVDQSFIDSMGGSDAGVYKFHWKLTKSVDPNMQSRFEWLQAQ
ncbi:capsular polysaccharide synthesis protein [Cycloclasticus sp.]|uniref:capsular polysaccharide synthesis protein n=1 Tax=Cycloclasticus sp. TaxID=2024830 RepID=UPI00257CD2C3|nr:capsular polysaccharide synthesis protein [Cycloclasticus sp.]